METIYFFEHSPYPQFKSKGKLHLSRKDVKVLSAMIVKEISIIFNWCLVWNFLVDLNNLERKNTSNLLMPCKIYKTMKFRQG